MTRPCFVIGVMGLKPNAPQWRGRRRKRLLAFNSPAYRPPRPSPSAAIDADYGRPAAVHHDQPPSRFSEHYHPQGIGNLETAPKLTRKQGQRKQGQTRHVPYDGNGSRLPATDPLTHPTTNT